MKLSLRKLKKYVISTKDDYTYKIEDVLINEDTWRIQYFKINIGGFFKKNFILVPRFLIDKVDINRKVVHFGLFGANIKNCPSFKSELPISKLYQKKLDRYFSKEDYWARHYYPPTGVPNVTRSCVVPPEPIKSKLKVIDESSIDSSLRSMNEILGYDVQSKDGEAGKLHDFIIDDESLDVLSFAVKFKGKLGMNIKVITASQFISEIRYSDQTIAVNLNTKEIQSSPDYSLKDGINHFLEKIALNLQQKNAN